MKDIARFYKVLADEARLQILWLLHSHRELCVCDITEVLGITQSKASRHLSTLRVAGLVADRREGAWCYYSLCPIEDDLQREQLEAVYRRLAEHPGAAQLLRHLRTRLGRRGLGVTCAADRAGSRTTNERNRA